MTKFITDKSTRTINGELTAKDGVLYIAREDSGEAEVLADKLSAFCGNTVKITVSYDSEES